MPLLSLPRGPVFARAIVFDKDGVLIDFDRYWGAVTRARVAGLAERPGLSEADRLELLALLGYEGGQVDPDGPLPMATRSELAAVVVGFLYRRGLPWVEAQERVRVAFEQAESRLAPGSLAECPGARRTLAELRGRHWRIGVATTDTAAHASYTLEALGMAELVEAIAGGDEVALGKPHPELFELVCRRLEVRPAEAVVVGDGVNDLLMARRGGACAAIGTLSGVSPHDQLVPHADLVIPDVTHLLSLTMAQ